jgi:hypothetical protein
MKKLLKRMLDESEFLSDYGVRALSRAHLEHPFVFKVGDVDQSVRYTPAESESGSSAATPIGADPSGFPEFPHHRIAAEISSLLRRRLQGGMPDRLGKISSPSRRSATELSQWRCRAYFLKDAAGDRPVLRHNRSCSGSELQGLHPVLRVLSRRHRPRRRRIASDGLDGADRQAAHAAGARLVRGWSRAC